MATCHHGSGTLAQPENLDHGIPPRKERPPREDAGDHARDQAGLEEEPVGDEALSRRAQPYEDAREPQNDTRLRVEALGVAIHRLPLERDLCSDEPHRG